MKNKSPKYFKEKPDGYDKLLKKYRDMNKIKSLELSNQDAEEIQNIKRDELV